MSATPMEATSTEEKNVHVQYKSRRVKATKTGDHGKDFEKLFPVLQLCMLRQHGIENFELYSNAGSKKFDDVVLSFINKNGERVEIRVQIKHADEVTKGKTINFGELLNIGNKDSLMAFFSCYLEENLKRKNLFYLTNKTLPFKLNDKILVHECSFEIYPKVETETNKENYGRIYFVKVESSDEVLVTKKFGKRFKINVEDENNQKFFETFRESFYAFKKNEIDKKNNANIDKKIKVLTAAIEEPSRDKIDEKIKDFFTDFTFAIEQPSHADVDKEIKKLLLELKFDKYRAELAQYKIEDLFKIKNGKVQTVTNDELKKLFEEIKKLSDFGCLGGISVELFRRIERMKFKNNFINELKKEVDNKKVNVLITPKDLNSLGCRAICQIYGEDEIKNGKLIFMNKISFDNQKENILNSCDEFEILLIDAENSKIDAEFISELSRLIEKPQKVFVVTSADFDSSSTKTIKFSKNGKIIEQLEEECQNEIFELEVKFQSEDLKLSEILKSLSQFIQILDDETLAKILKGNFSLGGEIKNSNFDEEFNIERVYIDVKTNEQKLEKIIESFNSHKRKPILIQEVAGMGKTTELTKLGLAIKKIHKNFWVLKVELGTEKFAKAFTNWARKNEINIVNLFCDFTENNFEKKVFENLYEEGKVLILLDGFDEISGQFYLKFLQNVFHKIMSESSNAQRKYVMTSRTNLLEDLKICKTEDFNAIFKDQSEYFDFYHLKPIEATKQVEFFINWISNKSEIKTKDLNFEDKLKNFSGDLILKWSLSIDTNLLGIPLQLKMLTEIFTHKIDEIYPDKGEFPKIPDQMTLTGLFREFIDIQYLRLTTKENKIREMIIKICKINVEETHLKIASLILNRDTSKNNFDKFLDLKSILVSVGLIDFRNNEPTFIHRAYPEFLVAEKFIEIIFSKNEKINKEEEKIFEINKEDEKIFEIILLQGYRCDLSLIFVEEFLKMKETYPESAVKKILAFYSDAEDDMLVILKETFEAGLTKFYLFALECALDPQNREKYYKNIFILITQETTPKNRNMIKIFPQILKKGLKKFESDISSVEDYVNDKYKFDMFCIVSLIISKFFNESTLEEKEENLNAQKESFELVKGWKVLEDQEMRKKLILNRFKFNFDFKSEGEENFLNFFREFDVGLVKTLIDCREENNFYVFFLDLNGLKKPLELLKDWAQSQQKGLDFDEEVKNQRNSKKNEIIDYFKKKILDYDVNVLSESRFLNPKILIELLKEDVEKFDDLNFPFWNHGIDGRMSDKRLKKMEEIFSKGSQIKYEILFEAWLTKVFKFCSHWNVCHLRDLNSNELKKYLPPTSNLLKYVEFVTFSLLNFIKIGKIPCTELKLEVCLFLQKNIIRCTTVEFHIYIIDRKKMLNSIEERISCLNPDSSTNLIKTTQKCESCFFEKS